MKDKKIAIMAFVPLLMVLLMWGRLPKEVALQWNLSGAARYGSKWELLPFAGLNLLIGFGLPLSARLDPKRWNVLRFSASYASMIFMMELFMTALIGLVLLEAMCPGRISMPKAMTILIGILFICIGNQMPKMRQNFYIGIKTPWTLENRVVWCKAQRLGGKGMFFGGCLLAVCGFFVSEAWMLGLMIAVVIFGCIVPMGMSYIWYRQEEKKRSNEKI